jgi:hypothetical protein
MLFAKDVLAGKPGSEIIYDVKCTRHLADQITKYGGRPTMWKTGHSLMKAKLKETGAKLAGEMSGHIFFNDHWLVLTMPCIRPRVCLKYCPATRVAAPTYLPIFPIVSIPRN